MSRRLRVVLDTNVVLSALVFRNGPAARVKSAWQEDRIVPVASAHTAGELVRVLAYPKLKLTASEQEDLLADFLPWVQVVHMPRLSPVVPECRDVSDVPFLQLAVAAKAHMLVSGDKDLLALAGSRGLCPIVDVDTLLARLVKS